MRSLFWVSVFAVALFATSQPAAGIRHNQAKLAPMWNAENVLVIKSPDKIGGNVSTIADRMGRSPEESDEAGGRFPRCQILWNRVGLVEREEFASRGIVSKQESVLYSADRCRIVLKVVSGGGGRCPNQNIMGRRLAHVYSENLKLEEILEPRAIGQAVGLDLADLHPGALLRLEKVFALSVGFAGGVCSPDGGIGRSVRFATLPEGSAGITQDYEDPHSFDGRHVLSRPIKETLGAAFLLTSVGIILGFSRFYASSSVEEAFPWFCLIVGCFFVGAALLTILLCFW